MAKSPKLERNPVTRKNYNYTMGSVRLDFVLRQDNTQEMLYFKSLLEAALADVNTDLKNFRQEKK